MHIWGWMSPAELEWLRATAAEMRSVAEVGVLRGRSAFALLTGCPGPVYCLDPWSDPGDHAYRGFMESCGHFPNLFAVRGLSPAAASRVPKVDMVFIDADHAYESVRADIEVWLPKTRKLICGHDYSDPADYTPESGGYEGVKRAVDEAFGDRVRLAPGTSIWTVAL
jgi:hypothetical protein